MGSFFESYCNGYRQIQEELDCMCRLRETGATVQEIKFSGRFPEEKRRLHEMQQRPDCFSLKEYLGG